MKLTISHHKYAIRKVMAEFVGVALLVIFGAGAACQVVLSTNPGVAPSERGVSTPIPLVMPRDSQRFRSRSFRSISDGRSVSLRVPGSALVCLKDT